MAEIRTITTERPTHPRAWLILAFILCAEIMDLLDSTIVNVAAPSIRLELQSSTTDLQWITGGYSLTFAAFLIAGARLGDRFGRRNLFLVGAWGFVLFSAACALAPNSDVLIAARLLQGATAALLIPQGLGLIQAAFSPTDQGKAFGVFGPVVGLAAVLGPVIGGVLVSANLFGTGWRSVFLINVPIGIVAAIGGARVLPESRQEAAPRLDLVGTVLVAAAVALLTYPLIQGRTYGWPVWIYLMIAAGAAALGLSVLWTRMRIRWHKDPLVQPSIFTHRGFSGGSILTVIFFGGSFGVGLALTLFLQLGLGFSAIHAGLTALPFAVGSTAGAFLGAGLLAPKLGRTTIQLGNALQGAGLIGVLIVVTHTQMHTTTWDLVAPLTVWGVGVGLVVAPLFDFVLASLAKNEVGSGSGVLNTLQQLGTAIGIAVIGTVFFSTIPSHIDAPGHREYVVGFERALEVGIGIALVLCAITLLLPKTARGVEN
jgi:EmrB/QacA subfamily drug resistance transporter